MSIAKGEKLKQVFADRWKKGVKRELLVWNIINLYLPEDYIALFTGIGSGSGEYVNGNYDNPLNAFDIVVFDKRLWIPVAFIEITGVERASDMAKHKGLCIGAWKIYKAEKFKVTDRVWYIHVLTSKASIRVINHYKLKKKAKFTVLHEGYGLYGKFYCLDSKYWDDIDTFLKWLMVKRK